MLIMNHPFSIPIIRARAETEFSGVPESSGKKCVVVSSGDLQEGDADYQLLNRILAAVHVNLRSEVLLLQVSTHSKAPGFTGLSGELQGVPVLCFGFSPDILGFHIQAERYQPVHFYGFDWVFGDSLEEISNNTNSKKMLWSALQVAFRI